jgi:hypothetical protein
VKPRIIGFLVALAFLVVELQGLAVAAVLTTQSQTFIGAAGSLKFTGDVPQCDTSTAAVAVLTLPDSTLAPTSADTQLAWTPSGSQSSAYQIEVIDPSGKSAATWTIGANSKTQVTYFKSGEPDGAWSFHESGLRSSVCSNGALMGSPGTAPGTAAWYEQQK